MSIIFAAIIGLAAGLLVDYLADAILTRQKWGRPFCAYCGVTRSWKDYFTLAPCRACQKPRPWRASITLFIGLILSVLLWIYPPLKLGYWFSLVLVTFMGVVIVIDVEHRLILHIVSLVGAIIGLIIGTITNGFLATLLGGVVGFVFMFIFYFFGIQFARYRSRKSGLENSDEEALGFGDVTISGVLGLLMGISNVLYGLITGILLAGVFSILLIVGLLIAKRFKSGDVYIPYGPFLILGACVYIFLK
jgi:leader peptidase (prepilin peptidase)/N-methyltransferase